MWPIVRYEVIRPNTSFACSTNSSHAHVRAPAGEALDSFDCCLVPIRYSNDMCYRCSCTCGTWVMTRARFGSFLQVRNDSDTCIYQT
jgi:hypothetical protein